MGLKLKVVAGGRGFDSCMSFDEWRRGKKGESDVFLESSS